MCGMATLSLASSGLTGPSSRRRRQARPRSGCPCRNSRLSRTSRSANEMTEMGRRFTWVGLILVALLWSWPSAGQQPGPDDPLPAGAHGDVFTLKGEVLDLKPQILEIKGVASGVKAQVGDVQGALKDLGAKVTGREIKINLSAHVLFDFDNWDLRPEARPSLEKVLAVLHAYPNPAALIDGPTDCNAHHQ